MWCLKRNMLIRHITRAWKATTTRLRCPFVFSLWTLCLKSIPQDARSFCCLHWSERSIVPLHSTFLIFSLYFFHFLLFLIFFLNYHHHGIIARRPHYNNTPVSLARILRKMRKSLPLTDSSRPEGTVNCIHLPCKIQPDGSERIVFVLLTLRQDD